MVVFIGGLTEGSGMDDEVVGGICQNPVHPAQDPPKAVGQSAVPLHFFKGGDVPARDDPRLKGEARGEGRYGDDPVPLLDDPDLCGELLFDDGAEDALMVVIIIPVRPFHLFGYLYRDDRQGDQLGMRMLQRGPGGGTMIFEDHDETEAGILFQGEHPLAVCPNDSRYPLCLEAG